MAQKRKNLIKDLFKFPHDYTLYDLQMNQRRNKGISCS